MDEPAVKRARIHEHSLTHAPEYFEAERVAKMMKTDNCVGRVVNRHSYMEEQIVKEAQESRDIRAANEIRFLLREQGREPWKIGQLDLPDFYLRLSDPETKMDFDVTVRDPDTLGPVLRQVYEQHAKPSPFGDLEKNLTVFDDQVRKGRELTAELVTLDANTLDAVLVLWKEEMDSFPVRVEPHKLVLYGPGDHFAEHTDTPAPGLVGSFVLGLFDDADGGGLVVDDSARSEQKASFGRYWAFRPDLYHEVKEITGGLRCALTFKIFARQPCESSHDHDCPAELHFLCRELATHLQTLVEVGEGTAGVILTQQYASSETCFGGDDFLLFCAATHVPNLVSVQNCPVRIHLEASDEGRDDVEVESVKVHVLGDFRLEINFYAVSNVRGECFRRERSHGGYTGNETAPSTESAIYLHRVLVITARVGDSE